VITQDDIRRSGATSIPEALRLAPGVEVERIDGDKWSIGIRGFDSRLNRSVLVLIDGRSVYTTLIAGTYWEVQDTVMEDIDRIEVIRGPGGTVWGPNAVQGVINIITKSSEDTQGALVSTGGGNEEQGFLAARYGGGDPNGLSYRFYAKAFNRSPEIHSDLNVNDAIALPKSLCGYKKRQGQKDKREELHKMMQPMKTLSGLVLPFHKSKLTCQVERFQFGMLARLASNASS
jgi:iron complex outermembrane receptor protein